MVSSTVVVTGSAITVLAVALIAYYSLTGKKVNGQAVTSFDLSGIDSKGNTLYLNIDSNGLLNYDLLYAPNQKGEMLLNRLTESSGTPAEYDVILDYKTYTPTSKWENKKQDLSFSNPTMKYTNTTITLTSADGREMTILISNITNAPTSFGPFTVTSFNAGAFASRPTANLADPIAANIFTTPSGPELKNPSRSRNLGHRDLADAANPSSAALKNCMNEIAWLAYKTLGGPDYTVYINTCPPSAGSGGTYGTYPIEDPANPGLVLSGSGGYCLKSSDTKFCGSVLAPTDTVVGFQGTSMNGGQYQDLWDDAVMFADNGVTGYAGSKGYKDGEATYTYCTGHSLGGARAKVAGINGRCGKVITFAAPLIDYGSTTTPITQYVRITPGNGNSAYCSGSGNYAQAAFTDIVPTIGYAFGSNVNVQYTLMNANGNIATDNQIDGNSGQGSTGAWAEGHTYNCYPYSCNWGCWDWHCGYRSTCYYQCSSCTSGLLNQFVYYGGTPTFGLHVFGKSYPYQLSDNY